MADARKRTAADSLLALDIGGANIKLADGRGHAASVPFALWEAPGQLAEKVHSCLTTMPAADIVVVTMTGELADCFPTKSAGVQHIVGAVIEATERCEVLIYLTDGRFVTPAEAVQQPLAAAASNWHALATFVSRYCEGAALLLDAGSTTIDLIPVIDKSPATRGRTDTERLTHGELVYTGVERSPVCAIVRELPWSGTRCPVAQELFATTADVYLLLGDLPEDPSNTDTADRQPRTRLAAHARLARCICADSTLFSMDEAVAAGRVVADAQVELLSAAYSQVAEAMPHPPNTLITSGHGEFLIRRFIERTGFGGTVISLTKILGPNVSRAATAHALAVFARQHLTL